MRDPGRGVLTPVLTCRTCGVPVYFGLTAKGKRCPYDLDSTGEPTRVSHFTTCPSAPRRHKPKQELA